MKSPNDYQLVDSYFAEKMAPEGSEPVRQFLAQLLKSAREGHLCIPEEITLPEPLFEEALVKQEGRIYLRRNWESEQRFLHHFHRLKRAAPTISIPELTFSDLEAEQREAINKAAKYSLSLICGGPGTGKTYTAARLIRSFLPYLNPVVAAPTGKAAANLRRALKDSCPVKTLHSLLKRSYLTADLVLVDEASMIDAALMASLFAAIKKGARLVLIGDKDQLPPVESGNFFVDLATEKAFTTTLNTCLRAELKEIIDMAKAVKEGNLVETKPLPEFATLIEAVLERHACLLTPLRQGPFGVNRLNEKLLKEHVKRGGKRFPIMITVNDSSFDLYNGDLGELVPEEKCAYFGERKVPDYLLPPFQYAYVLSVHKSQGSEYDEVLILLPEGSEVFGREMLYTAITRAKKRVEIYSPEGVIAQIVSKRDRRLSGLSLVN